jgi:methylmalonyl-CoA mutase
VALDASILDEPFADASRADWERAALKAARLDSIDALRSAFGGIPVSPLPERRADAAPLAMRRPGWLAFQRVDDPDAARAAAQAERDAEDGADGLALVFEGAHNAFGRGLPAQEGALLRVLDRIDLERTAIRIDAHPAIRKSAEWLARLIESRKPDVKRLRLAAGIDHAAILAATGRLGMSPDALAASLPQSLAGFFAFGLPGTILEADARIIANSGGTAPQELGFALAVAVGHLRLFDQARQPVGYAAASLGFSLSSGCDLPGTIAKLRSLRVLWARILEASGINSAPPLRLHVETNFAMMSVRDAETNILRNAIATAGAAIGGADTVSVLPHSIACGLPEAAARRLALMAQVIARDESHLGRVADMAAGSGAIESLTEDLCQAAWDEFRRLEASGGALAAVIAGDVQSGIAEARAARRAGAASRKIIGVNAFAARDPRHPAVLAHDAVAAEFPAAIRAVPLAAVNLDAETDAGGAP